MSVSDIIMRKKINECENGEKKSMAAKNQRISWQLFTKELLIFTGKFCVYVCV